MTTDYPRLLFCARDHIEVVQEIFSLNFEKTRSPRIETVDSAPAGEPIDLLTPPPWLWPEKGFSHRESFDGIDKLQEWQAFTRLALQLTNQSKARLWPVPSVGRHTQLECLIRAHLEAVDPVTVGLWNRVDSVLTGETSTPRDFDFWSSLWGFAKEHVSRSEAQAESDLLLAQLHQVQEELARYYLLTKDYEQLKQSAQHLENEIRSSKAAQEKLQAELQAEKKLLSDITAKLETAKKAELDQRNKLSADLKSEQAAKTESQTECKKLRQDLDRATQNLRDAQAESDLLLAQLHEVQEELERYYLLTKDYEQCSTRAAQALKAARLQIQKNWIAAGLQLN